MNVSRWPAALAAGVFKTVQRRLEALLLGATVPVALLAGYIAWQNYRMVSARPHARAVTALVTAESGIEAVLDTAHYVGVTASKAWLRDAAVSRAGTDVAMWIIGAGGEVVALSDNATGRLPHEPVLSRLIMGHDVANPEQGGDGHPYAYALGPLKSGARLLVAYPAAGDLASAQEVLARRTVELGLLMLAGLAAVAYGAGRGVVRPLGRLAAAVRGWRAGGSFDAGLGRLAPLEIAELASSFQEATTALTQREAQLRQAVIKQDLLMQEIHHRVKNNLQIIASLLNLQASRIKQPQARAEFQTARDRIRALATLHRHLYAEGELHTINMRSFLTELCDQLVQAIMDKVPEGADGRRAADRIVVTIEAPELTISSDQAVPIALIVTEAVSNAAKYAFPGGRRGNIRVRLTVTADDRALLEIADDGVGIPAGRAETETGMRDGIGIQLIRGFARQLGATLTVTQETGTHYAVDLPLRRERAAEEEPASDRHDEMA